MEKYLVFIPFILFFNNWMIRVSGCELNSDCSRGLYCCKEIKSCRSSCEDVVCNSDKDCGSPSSKCCSINKRCTADRDGCSDKTVKLFLIVVLVPVGTVVLCLIIACCVVTGGKCVSGGGGSFSRLYRSGGNSNGGFDCGAEDGGKSCRGNDCGEETVAIVTGEAIVGEGVWQ